VLWSLYLLCSLYLSVIVMAPTHTKNKSGMIFFHRLSHRSTSTSHKASHFASQLSSSRHGCSTHVLAVFREVSKETSWVRKVSRSSTCSSNERRYGQRMSDTEVTGGLYFRSPVPHITCNSTYRTFPWAKWSTLAPSRPKATL
jgi:hypothetical protein